MIKNEFALLYTGCYTIDEFIEAFWDNKSINYTTKNIQREFCNEDQCNSLKCNECFIYNALQAIYKINPFA